MMCCTISVLSRRTTFNHQIDYIYIANKLKLPWNSHCSSYNAIRHNVSMFSSACPQSSLWYYNLHCGLSLSTNVEQKWTHHTLEPLEFLCTLVVINVIIFVCILYFFLLLWSYFVCVDKIRVIISYLSGRFTFIS